MSEQIEQEKTIHYNDAKIWQIAFFSMNNTAANLYLALMAISHTMPIPWLAFQLC